MALGWSVTPQCICLHKDFISITRNVVLADILHREEGFMQNWVCNSISLSQIIYVFGKCMVSNCLNKIH